MGTAEVVAVATLRPHPHNYRSHPPAQLAHIEASLKEHGVYRNVVVARDDVILAGHGVVEGAKLAGLAEIPIVRLDIDSDSPSAYRVLAGDNEMMRLAEVDDRALTEMLREVRDADDIGLLGTGFDDAMLASLLMVTRPTTEVEGFDAAAEWVGMPEMSARDEGFVIVMRCRTAEERDQLVAHLALESVERRASAWTARWPPQRREDKASVLFEG